MTNKEFNLSEKRIFLGASWKYFEKDIKEFIKRLKDICDRTDGSVTIEEIDNLAGDRLIGEDEK